MLKSRAHSPTAEIVCDLDGRELIIEQNALGETLRGDAARQWLSARLAGARDQAGLQQAADRTELERTTRRLRFVYRLPFLRLIGAPIVVWLERRRRQLLRQTEAKAAGQAADLRLTFRMTEPQIEAYRGLIGALNGVTAAEHIWSIDVSQIADQHAELDRLSLETSYNRMPALWRNSGHPQMPAGDLAFTFEHGDNRVYLYPLFLLIVEPEGGTELVPITDIFLNIKDVLYLEEADRPGDAPVISRARVKVRQRGRWVRQEFPLLRYSAVRLGGRSTRQLSFLVSRQQAIAALVQRLTEYLTQLVKSNLAATAEPGETDDEANQKKHLLRLGESKKHADTPQPQPSLWRWGYPYPELVALGLAALLFSIDSRQLLVDAGWLQAAQPPAAAAPAEPLSPPADNGMTIPAPDAEPPETIPHGTLSDEAIPPAPPAEPITDAALEALEDVSIETAPIEVLPSERAIVAIDPSDPVAARDEAATSDETVPQTPIVQPPLPRPAALVATEPSGALRPLPQLRRDPVPAQLEAAEPDGLPQQPTREP